ncbi:MAG: hypothetical protein AAGH87_11015 [Pseudomonadota bacterium]
MTRQLAMTAALIAACAFIVGVIAIGAYRASGLASTGLPPTLWLAYGVGAVATITVGSGLFWLTFHSARAGYDDIDRPEDGPDG